MDDQETILNSSLNKEKTVNAVSTPDLKVVNPDCPMLNEGFYKENILDAKEFSRIVKAIECLIRRSEEYKTFIFLIKDEVGLKSCSVLRNVGEDEEVTIEIDHYPFSLYDICAAVVTKHIENHEAFNTYMVADEVMKLHFDFKVGVVPLSKTLHQLRHSGKIFIRLDQVAGNFMAFAKEYEKYIEPETLANFGKLVEMTHNNSPLSPDPNMLKVRSQDFGMDNKGLEFLSAPRALPVNKDSEK